MKERKKEKLMNETACNLEKHVRALTDDIGLRGVPHQIRQDAARYHPSMHGHVFQDYKQFRS